MPSSSENQYLKTSQVVPGKGMSYTYYEVEGADTILRMLTSLPEVDEISIYPRPPVKKLFAPDRCEAATEEEFSRLWQEGEARKA